MTFLWPEMLWLLLLVPGWIAWTLISLWFLYRIVKGMVRMHARQPVDPAPYGL